MKLSTVTNRFIRLLACGATVAALALVAPAAAQAAQSCQAEAAPKAAALPAPGQSFNLDATSTGIQFTVAGKTLTSAPLRGTLTVDIEANRADKKKLSVAAKPSDLKLTTKAAQTHTVTVDQVNATVDEKSILRLVKPKPVTYEHLMALNLTFSVTLPAPTPTEADETIQLETAEPVLLTGSLKSFPPKNSTYSLIEPVKLNPVEGADADEVLLSGFDLIVNQSS